MRSQSSRENHATRRILAVVGSLAALVASNIAAAHPSTDPAHAASTAVPIVDHHTHLWSKQAAAIHLPPALAPIAVPAEIDSVLRAREAATDSGMFTQNAIALDTRGPHWVAGDRIAEHVKSFRPGFKLVPVAYAVADDFAFVAGTMARGEPGSLQHTRSFQLTLRRAEDGSWKIASEMLTERAPPVPEPATAEKLISEMDAAGVRKSVVLSVAYWFGSPLFPPVENEYAAVSAENDWAIAETAKFSDRLVPICSVNPLKDYALRELNRCSVQPRVKGIKLHFGNSGVDLRNPAHVAKLQQFFQAVNRKRLAIIAHLWTLDETYGREHSQIFLDKILPSAPDIPIQIAHLAGGGGFDSDEAIAVFADAIEAGDRRTKNLLVEISHVAVGSTPAASDELLVRRLRQIGINRILFGSDRAGTMMQSPADAWKAIARLPLTPTEIRMIAGNVAPYLRVGD